MKCLLFLLLCDVDIGSGVVCVQWVQLAYCGVAVQQHVALEGFPLNFLLQVYDTVYSQAWCVPTECSTFCMSNETPP